MEENQLLTRMEALVSNKLAAFETKICETQKQLAEAQIAKFQQSFVSNDNYQFRKKGNEEQFKINFKVLGSLREAEGQLSDMAAEGSSKAEAVRQKVVEGMSTLIHRQKLIKLADSTDLGWRVVNEYEAHPLAEDSDDEKKIFRAQLHADRKAKQERRARTKRNAPYVVPATSSQSAVTSPSGARIQTIGRKPGLCFRCGKPGHWQADCKMRSTEVQDAKASQISRFYVNPVSLLNNWSNKKVFDSRSRENNEKVLSPVGKLRENISHWEKAGASLKIEEAIIDNIYEAGVSPEVAPAQPVVDAQPGQQAVYSQPLQPGQQYAGQPGQPYAGQPGQPYAGQLGQPIAGQPGQPYAGQLGQPIAGQPGQQAMYGGLGGVMASAQPPPPVWMPKPATGAPNCPQGLEYLTQIDQILIKQKIELMELFTNWEAKNKYRILNTLGQQVYLPKRVSKMYNYLYFTLKSETCMRQCCRENRSFTMHITDNLDHEVIRLQREFRCWKESNWCAFSDCCAHKIAVEAPVGTVVGYVQQRPSFMAPKYKIMDADEKDVLYIEGPCCVFQGCPCDVNFTIFSATDGETEVGKIQKQWGNLLQEMFTSADNFGVTFPMDLDVKMKAVMLGATFLIVSYQKYYFHSC
ncbi:uncharacterized protein LOC132729545 [Ruditapes philippinarum]|uniref:uncharacterized protein LOC132729545 n=1 Tax=Ruditapes philippinarum TaxID=129788 RepID=UPI00295BA965|nr:uncharacterized protein LOC132729545 [Ruditapes philippinarum]